MSETAPAEIPVADLPPLLRVGQARALANAFGISNYQFRCLVESGAIHRRTIGGGVRHYYFRDQIIEAIQPGSRPL